MADDNTSLSCSITTEFPCGYYKHTGNRAPAVNVLTSVVHSKLLYAAPIWSTIGTKTAKNRYAMTRTQRLIALRVIRAYRTVSDQAALMLARIPPADLLAKERCRVSERRKNMEPNNSNTSIKLEERYLTINLWQTAWETTPKAAWTRRLLPDVGRWFRSNTEVSYHLAQAFTGHGCFRHYLWRMKRSLGAGCIYCNNPRDDAEHTIFECPAWSNYRLPVGQFVGGRDPTPEDVMDLLCGPHNCPDDQKAAAERANLSFITMVHNILQEKEDDERKLEEAARRRRNGD